MNGERMTPSSAIIDIGASVLVNAAYLARPVPGHRHRARRTCIARLSARRPAASTSSGPARGSFGIRVSFAEPESVDMPAFAGTVTLRYARPRRQPGREPVAGPGRR